MSDRSHSDSVQALELRRKTSLNAPREIPTQRILMQSLLLFTAVEVAYKGC